eukprot:4964570-Pleurochrysis_carterae.AAC.1
MAPRRGPASARRATERRPPRPTSGRTRTWRARATPSGAPATATRRAAQAGRRTGGSTARPRAEA